MPRSNRRWRETTPALVVLIAGLVVTGLAYLTTWASEHEEEATRLARNGELAARLFSETMELAITQVRSVQAFFEASEEVTSVEFSRFALHQGTSPGMVAIGYAPVVDPGDFEAFRREATAEKSFFVVTDVDRHVVDAPAPDRPVVPVWYGFQHVLGPSILGVDLASDPVRLAAIERALTSGSPTVSGKVHMLGQGDTGFVEVYAPLRQGIFQEPAVVFASIGLADLIAEDTRTALGSTSILFTDVTDGQPATAVSDETRWVDRVVIEGRAWQVELIAGESDTNSPLLMAVALAGTAISVLAALVAYQFASSRQRAREIEELRRTTSEKDVFLASVAHELRTPLTSVVGVTALLAEAWRGLDDVEVDDLLSITHAEATDLADLIEDLLVAGRLEAGAIHCRAETVDLETEIARVVARVITDRALTIDFDEDARLVHADPLRVRQIIRNLIVNAVRHADSLVSVTTHREGMDTTVVVSNDGSPIPAELEQVLFRPYQEGRPRDHQGSIGLGLPVSRRLAELMDGELTYTYADGWCRFRLRLPSAEMTVAGSVLAPQTTTQTRSPSALG